MKTTVCKNSIAACVLAFAGVPIGLAGAAVNAVTPSTNDINRTNGWAHVDQAAPGSRDFTFISTRSFWSCFEYRTDGDTGQANGSPNPNSGVTDGFYPYFCQRNDSRTATINAQSYVEIRMVFGAESDERFDWTRFDVSPAYACTGFEPPADDAIVVKKPNRVLPLRMMLTDSDGLPVWDIASPVVSVSYTPVGGVAQEFTEELTYAGRGDEGNQFLFDGSRWGFNLSTQGLAPGEYTITAASGSPDYAISPTCSVVLTVQ